MNGEAVIIGCGAAGLSAALFLARHNCKSVLVADMPPERSQSGLALGGINAALGEDDSAEKQNKLSPLPATLRPLLLVELPVFFPFKKKKKILRFC